jgi:ubiquinone/menaquinone biosynthesis C-methylase UbiE
VSDVKADSRRHFDRWARTYEQDPTSRWLADLQRQAVETLELGAADRLLDVGCGTGAAVRHAADSVGRAVGVDLSPAMIDRARELAMEAPGAEFRVGDSENLPFADGEFTAVLCTTSFHHYPDPQRALGEMARVLAPGGRLVVADGCRDLLPARLFDEILRRVQPSHVGLHRSRDLERMLATAGLVGPRSRRLLAGGYAIVRAEKPAG